jgi:hypothetical protein
VAEIRSTIDLMMERTRGMTLSTSERDDLRREEFAKRAKGLRLRLLTEGENIEDILSAIDAESPEDRDALRKALWQVMVEMLPLNGDDFLRSVTVMEQLPQARTKESVLRDIRGCFKHALKRQAEDRKKVVTREKKKLAAFGISGSAAVPKIPSGSVWDDQFHADMAKLKEALLSPSS